MEAFRDKMDLESIFQLAAVDDEESLPEIAASATCPDRAEDRSLAGRDEKSDYRLKKQRYLRPEIVFSKRHQQGHEGFSR